MEIEESLHIPLNIEAGKYQLTDLPVIIYDYDSRPKYYEFGVIVEGKLTASITTIAQKESANMVAFIFPEPLIYDEIYYKYFVGAYPNIYYGMPSAPYEAPLVLYKADKTTIINDIPSCNDFDNLRTTLQNIELEADENIEEYENAISNMEGEIAERQNEVEEFWNVVDEKYDEILQMSDKEILLKTQNNLLQKATKTTWKQYIIPKYNSTQMKYTRWSSACGPAAVAWAYRGLYKYYPTWGYNYIRVFGDGALAAFRYNVTKTRAFYKYNETEVANEQVKNLSQITDNGLFYTIWNDYSKPIGKNNYYMTPTQMSKAMQKITNNKYKVNLCTQPHSWIRTNKLPVFLLMTYEWCPHYMVAFGSGYEKKKNRIKNKYLLVIDNGTMISSHSYAPYWRSATNLYYKLHQ